MEDLNAHYSVGEALSWEQMIQTKKEEKELSLYNPFENLGQSVSSSMPPGAVVVGACGAFSRAHLAARASSRARFFCRSEGGGMATAGCAGGRPVRARGVLRFSGARLTHTVVLTG